MPPLTEKRQPNILLLCTDQQRWDTVGSLGNWVRTPHMDRIAAEGVLFTNAVSPCPVCVPARVAQARGLYPHNTGLWENANFPFSMAMPNWMQAVRAAGYRTAIIGKSHLHKHPRNAGQLVETVGWMQDAGIDDVHETGGSGGDRVFYGEFTQELERRGLWEAYREAFKVHGDENNPPQVGAYMLPGELYGDAWIGRRAQRYLEAYDRDQPWFCWVGFAGPHPPYDAPEPYASMYDPSDMPAPLPRYEWIDALGECSLHRVLQKYPAMEPDLAARARANYAGKLTLIDDWIGQLLDVVEQRGELDHTVIVVTSDHGGHNGDLGLTHKRTFFDGSVRVPLIIRTPESARIGGGRTCESPCEWIDVGPTLVDAAAGSIAHKQFGRSLLPAVEDPQRDHRTFAISEYRGEMMILTPQWKMAVNWRGEPYLLFDVENDPHEADNLAARPDYACVRSELGQRLFEHLLSTQVQILNYWK